MRRREKNDRTPTEVAASSHSVSPRCNTNCHFERLIFPETCPNNNLESLLCHFMALRYALHNAAATANSIGYEKMAPRQSWQMSS